MSIGVFIYEKILKLFPDCRQRRVLPRRPLVIRYRQSDGISSDFGKTMINSSAASRSAIAKIPIVRNNGTIGVAGTAAVKTNPAIDSSGFVRAGVGNRRLIGRRRRWVVQNRSAGVH